MIGFPPEARGNDNAPETRGMTTPEALGMTTPEALGMTTPEALGNDRYDE